MASRWLLFRMVLQFKCESYDELLSLLIIGTAFRGVGHDQLKDRRTNATFRRLKKMLIGAGVSVTRWITDQWIAYYNTLIPQERIASKAELQSLERKHLTLRTRIRRLTRKAIYFSKSGIIHKAIVGLFINNYFFGLNQHL
jgi:insertion element IS1 protein InsB